MTVLPIAVTPESEISVRKKT